jgi:trehalose 6-phosphate phosphatase
VLASYADANVLVAFDFDGTLAPLIADPCRAELPRRTRTLLRALAQRFPVAILSDRRADDIAQRVQGTDAWVVVGHEPMWLENAQTVSDLRQRVVGWRSRVERLLGVRTDIRVEDKDFALALHYRNAPHEDEARRAIAEALTGIDGANAVFGNRVVNISPDGALSKPAALRRVLRDFGCDATIYVGDDTEDEAVFRLKDAIPLVGIRVGPSTPTAASYVIENQCDVEKLLRLLVRLRRPFVSDRRTRRTTPEPR